MTLEQPAAAHTENAISYCMAPPKEQESRGQKAEDQEGLLLKRHQNDYYLISQGS